MQDSTKLYRNLIHKYGSECRRVTRLKRLGRSAHCAKRDINVRPAQTCSSPSRREMSLMDTMDSFHSPSDEERFLMDLSESYSSSHGSSVEDVTMAGSSYQSDPYTGTTQGIAVMVAEAAGSQNRHTDDLELDALIYQYDYLQLQFISRLSCMQVINGELHYRCAGCLRSHHSLSALQRHIALSRQEGFSCRVFYRATWQRLQHLVAPACGRKRKRSADSSASTSSPTAKRRRPHGPV